MSNNYTEITEAPVEPETTEEVIDFQTPGEVFFFARKQIAQTLVRVINHISGNASISDENDEGVTLNLGTFDFDLTALCGGYFVSKGENGRVREEEFIALDGFFDCLYGHGEEFEDEKYYTAEV